MLFYVRKSELTGDRAAAHQRLLAKSLALTSSSASSTGPVQRLSSSPLSSSTLAAATPTLAAEQDDGMTEEDLASYEATVDAQRTRSNGTDGETVDGTAIVACLVERVADWASWLLGNGCGPITNIFKYFQFRFQHDGSDAVVMDTRHLALWNRLDVDAQWPRDKRITVVNDAMAAAAKEANTYAANPATIPPAAMNSATLQLLRRTGDAYRDKMQVYQRTHADPAIKATGDYYYSEWNTCVSQCAAEAIRARFPCGNCCSLATKLRPLKQKLGKLKRTPDASAATLGQLGSEVKSLISEYKLHLAACACAREPCWWASCSWANAKYDGSDNAPDIITPGNIIIRSATLDTNGHLVAPTEGTTCASPWVRGC